MVGRLDQPLAALRTADDLLRVRVALLVGIVVKAQVPTLHKALYRPECMPALTLV